MPSGLRSSSSLVVPSFGVFVVIYLFILFFCFCFTWVTKYFLLVFSMPGSVQDWRRGVSAGSWGFHVGVWRERAQEKQNAVRHRVGTERPRWHEPRAEDWDDSRQVYCYYVVGFFVVLIPGISEVEEEVIIFFLDTFLLTGILCDCLCVHG